MRPPSAEEQEKPCVVSKITVKKIETTMNDYADVVGDEIENNEQEDRSHSIDLCKEEDNVENEISLQEESALEEE